MTAEILELPEVIARFSPLSVEEYHQLGEYNHNHRRTELVRGIVIEKVSKSPLHSTVAKLVAQQIEPAVPNGFHTRRDDPLTFTDSEPEPDFALVRGLPNDFRDAHPRTAELVVEIAVTSVALDRANAALYAENQVKEYWIVIAQQKAVEVYRELEGGVYREKSIHKGDETIACAACPQITLKVRDLFD